MTLRISVILIIVLSLAALLGRLGSGASVQPLERSTEVLVPEIDPLQPPPQDLARIESATKNLDASTGVQPSPGEVDGNAIERLEHQLAESVSERDTLREELAAQARTIRELQDLIALDSPELVSTNFAAWVSAAAPINDINPNDVAMVKEYAAQFPGVQLSAAEGRWIAERNRFDDWQDFAPTCDEAVIRFLGPQRVLSSLSADDAKWLREQWEDERLFK